MVAEKYIISLNAGMHDRVNCPVSIELPDNISANKHFKLIQVDSTSPIPVQTARNGSKSTLHWLVTRLKAGESRQYQLEVDTKKEQEDRVILENDKNNQIINVSILGKPFTNYHYSDSWARPFLHPVIGPHDLEVTRGWPVVEDIPGETNDHPHHKSIWVAYGECGKVDNWSEEPGHGVQRHQNFRKLLSGPVFGQIQAKNFWCNASGRKQFEEIRDITIYALPAGERLVDFSISFHMTESAVTFHDTKEGGLISVRVATPLDGDKSGLITNGYGGVSEVETWGKKAPWCDYSGTLNDRSLGICLYDHEQNPRYPTEWHVRDYGLMTANCFGWKYFRPETKEKGDMQFKKGQKTCWRYRMYIHKGNAERAYVGDRFFDFVAPPVPTFS